MDVNLGVTERIYLAGTYLASGAEVLKLSPAEIKTVNTRADGLTTEHYMRSWATSTIGAPRPIRKWRASFDYRLGASGTQATDDAEYLLFQRIGARAGFWDLCVFRPIVECFDGTSLLQFRLSHGIAVQQSGASGAPGILPAGLTLNEGYAAYSTEVYGDGVLLNPANVTFDSARDANGRQKFTLVTNYFRVTCLYVPVMTARRVSCEPVFVLPHGERARVTLESFS